MQLFLSKGGSSSLSSGALAGIIVGGVFGFLVIPVLVIIVCALLIMSRYSRKPVTRAIPDNLPLNRCVLSVLLYLLCHNSYDFGKSASLGSLSESNGRYVNHDGTIPRDKSSACSAHIIHCTAHDMLWLDSSYNNVWVLSILIVWLTGVQLTIQSIMPIVDTLEPNKLSLL